jgi:endonuclease/exonuclease/phosphatase family metal-dependent hydrolase
MRKAFSFGWRVGLLAVVVGLTGAGCRGPKTGGGFALRVMSYNIHHGEGLDGRVDLERIGGVIQRERPDLVALQEVDKGVQRTQCRDFPAELAALTGMTCVFSNNYPYQGGEYGNAILSRLPVVGWTNRHYRMLRPGEQRGLLEVRAKVGRRLVRFLATHIDFRGDDSERVLNVGEIRAAVESEPDLPAIVAGDFNDLPGRRVHRLMKEFVADAWEAGGEGDGFTIPASAPQRRIDYVFVTRGITVDRAWVPETEASDHRPVLAELRQR